MKAFIVFDCDGTLVDSQHVIIEAVSMAFAAHAIERPDDQAIRHIVGLSLHEAMAALLGEDRAGAAPALAESYRQAFFDLRRRDGHRHEPLYGGIRETLDALRNADVLMGVATGKSQRGLRAILEHHGLKDHFISLQTADHHPSKPHPAMLRAAMEDAGVTASRTVMIGDTSYDMMMARAAGAVPLGVGWGYHAPDLLKEAGAQDIALDGGSLHGHILSLIEEARR